MGWASNLFPHGGELHLPRRVQDVQEARLRVDDRPLLVGVLDGGVVVVDEVVLDVLKRERRLADAAVAQNDDSIPTQAGGLSRRRHVGRLLSTVGSN